jgi:beta-galactosidase GanA
MVEPFGNIYAAFRPMAQLWGQWVLEGRTHGIAESDERKPQSLQMKNWGVTASFREWQFGTLGEGAREQDLPPDTAVPNGGAAFAQVGDNEFVVIGQHIRLHFQPTGVNEGKPFMFARVEEGHFDARGQWIMERNWNGDQTDHGLNLTGKPTVLKIRLRTY